MYVTAALKKAKQKKAPELLLKRSWVVFPPFSSSCLSCSSMVKRHVTNTAQLAAQKSFTGSLSSDLSPHKTAQPSS